MRIYIVHPQMFVRHADKIVTLVPKSLGHFGDYSVIRDQNGDYKRVKSHTLNSKLTYDQLVGELHSNIALREIALEDDLIEVGDYHQDDSGYLNYTLSF